MTKTLYLVRHGQTIFNYYHKVQGRCDSPLNSRGIQQVKKTHTYFKTHHIKFDLAFSSTQERASDTLEIITEHTIAYKRLKDLRERSYGIFEGGDAFLLPWNYGNNNLDPTIESDKNVVVRMQHGVLKILNNMQDNDVALVVGHGDSLAQYIRAATQKKDFPGFNNAGVAKLTFKNKTPHFESYVWPAAEIK